MKLDAFKAIVRGLDAEDVRFLVAGGMAVVAHGYGRVTFDIDLVVQLDPDNIVSAFAALNKIGYKPTVPVTAEQFANENQRATWIREKGMMVLCFFCDAHPATKVDVFVQEPFDFGTVYNNALQESFDDGLPFRVVDIDTLIIMKEAAGRPKDLDDIEHLQAIRDEQRTESS